MMNARKKMGTSTVQFDSPVIILSGGSVVGPEEYAGPLGSHFDMHIEDDLWGEKTWEKAECRMYTSAVETALGKANLKKEDADVLLGGDLLNQLITANYAARELDMPFLGLYGACSTMAESLGVGAMLIDGGFCEVVACAAASHFSTAERQYRSPIELGNQRAMCAQRTVTGSGASIIARTGEGARITHFTTGKVVDYGVTDAANMGAAMAPAAAHTIGVQFEDLKRFPSDYDLIVTGDLGSVGTTLLYELCERQGYDISKNHEDCGVAIFGPEQDTHAGGSGCGCSAVILNSVLLKRLEQGTYKRIMFVATGALMSPTTSMQGETIPGIAHAVCIESGGNC